ncbi:MAG TPA: DUF302 domain-containing protein [Gammaproteobacteria bacterium]|nr:DUF302 domain-containing protein [Gammaproteobacteria bacterium]
MTKQFLLILAAVLLLGTGPALAAPLQIDIAQTVVKRQLAEGVDADDAVESMKLRANMLNIKLVAELPLSKQIEAMGQASRRMEIYQFCDPLTAKKMVEYNIDFAAYLPCRIALVEDAAGKYWLVMMNLDMLIRGATLDASLKKEAEKVRDVLNEIMDAGVNGDL